MHAQAGFIIGYRKRLREYECPGPIQLDPEAAKLSSWPARSASDFVKKRKEGEKVVRHAAAVAAI